MATPVSPTAPAAPATLEQKGTRPSWGLTPYPVGGHEAHDSIRCAYCMYSTLAMNQLIDLYEDTFCCVRCRCPLAMGPEPSSKGELAARRKTLFPTRPRPAKLGYMALATNNRSALLRAGDAHCLCCRRTFASTEVKMWVDRCTAVCPYCSVDAVIPSTAGDRDRPEWWVECAHWRREGFSAPP